MYFGRDISAALAERPDYKWTVVSRSTAESGLADKKYDAIVYIPSDFTNNILSYNHKRPQKAELDFRVQAQLDAVNKEKVQRELQDAQKSVSKKMSSLYWNIVKLRMKDVRDEFDNIVDKESEFQNAMYNFTSRAQTTWPARWKDKRNDRQPERIDQPNERHLKRPQHRR